MEEAIIHTLDPSDSGLDAKGGQEDDSDSVFNAEGFKEAVKEYERPQTKKQVWAFLGLCGYYQRFILSYSTLACPLTELTKKNKVNADGLSRDQGS